jgi:hypothetical protein
MVSDGEDGDRSSATAIDDSYPSAPRSASTSASPEVGEDGDEATGGPVQDPLARLRPLLRWRGWAYVGPLLVLVVIGVVASINHFSGHDWGDDFALYMRQAKSLTIGNVGEVIRDNRYTVDNSGWHTFSPYLYPWGWPLIVAPFYALFGLDYAVFKFLEVVAFCVFLYLYYDIVKRRTEVVAAVLLLLLIGLSPSYIGATDTVLSDIPYLCVVFVALWWMDRCRRRGILEVDRRDLVILGLLLAFAFNVRREGITVVATLLALHVAVLGGIAVRARSLRPLRAVSPRKVVLPYATFAISVVAFQLLLPTDFIPSLPGAGLKNAHTHIPFYRDVFAENVGLKAAGQPMALFHSHTIASVLVTVIVVLAVIGMVFRLARHFERDVILAAYLCAAIFVMLDSPYQEGRYLLTISPLLLYFAYQALPAAAEFLSRHRELLFWAAAPPIAALTGLVLLNVHTVDKSTRFHLQVHYVVHGPEAPDAKEMFAAVKDMTRGTDVILFYRARAMTLYTDRLAVQGTDLDTMLPQVDWYVMEKGSTYSQTLLTDSQAAARGLTDAWENSEWVIWRVPRRP